MELYREILVHVLTGQDTSDSSSDLLCMLSQIVETTCYNALQKIKAIIHDDSLEDRECFLKMEEIIQRQIMRNVLLSNVYVDEEGEIHMILP